MSDEQQPVKKVGSLRDRIAQFEHKPENPPPVPQPRTGPPKQWNWKQRQSEAASSVISEPRSNPSSPPTNTLSVAEDHPSIEERASRVVSSAFSVSDAQSSISQSGSLRERMAALQRGGVGSSPSASNAPPPPPEGKPRVWKKVVVPYVPPEKPAPVRRHEEDEETETGAQSDAPEGDRSPPVRAKSPAHESIHDQDQERAASPSANEEDAEKERRAALAARMARLGGARIGYAPPPPVGKKPTVVRRESVESEVKELPKAVSPPPPPAEVVPLAASTPSSKTDTVSLISSSVESTTESSEQESSVEEPAEEPAAPVQPPNERVTTPPPPPPPAVSSPPRKRPPVPPSRSRSTSPANTATPLPNDKTRSQVSSQDDDEEDEGRQHHVEEDSGASTRSAIETDEGLDLHGVDEKKPTIHDGPSLEDEPDSRIMARSQYVSPDTTLSPPPLSAISDSTRLSVGSPPAPPPKSPRSPLPAIPKRTAPPRRMKSKQSAKGPEAPPEDPAEEKQPSVDSVAPEKISEQSESAAAEDTGVNVGTSETPAPKRSGSVDTPDQADGDVSIRT